MSLQLSLRAARIHARLGPILAVALALGAWTLVLLPAGRGLPVLWACAVSALAIAYGVMGTRGGARAAGPGWPVAVLLLAAGAVLGVGAGIPVQPAVGGWPGALVAVTCCAVAVPVLAVRPFLFLGLLAVLLGPLLPSALEAADVSAVSALVVAGVGLGLAQVALSRTLMRALRNDVEQRMLLGRLEEANQALSADRMALQTESRTDPLTGLANRRYLEETLQGEWNRCRRSGAPLSCVILDIDYFKAYNDHYGHDGGDACLRRVAALLSDSTRRAGDVVARFGGEEFVVLLPETGSDGASTVAELLKRAVMDSRIDHAKSSLGPFLTISLGVATLVPAPGRVPGELLKAADLALYEAKRSGRNRVVMADLETLDSARLAARGLIG